MAIPTGDIVVRLRYVADQAAFGLQSLEERNAWQADRLGEARAAVDSAEDAYGEMYLAAVEAVEEAFGRLTHVYRNGWLAATERADTEEAAHAENYIAAVETIEDLRGLVDSEGDAADKYARLSGERLMEFYDEQRAHAETYIEATRLAYDLGDMEWSRNGWRRIAVGFRPDLGEHTP